MNALLLLWLLGAGCGQRDGLPALPAAPEDQPTLDLGPRGAPVLRLLDQVGAAQIELPLSNLTEGGTAGTFLLREGWTEVRTGGARIGTSLWAHPLPIVLSKERFTSAPPGLRLVRGEAELAYAAGLSFGARRQTCWEVSGQSIYVNAATSPDLWDAPPVLLHAPTARREQRLNYQSSGLSRAVFARMAVTRDTVTRDSLYLPAPGSARFSVAVPAGARLRFGYALAPAPTPGSAGKADFLVKVNDELLWSASASAADGWGEASVDLSAYAGQQVSLSLATDPDGPNLEDYAAFATPEIVGAPTGGARRVVVVGIDTLRADHLGVYGYDRPTSPGIDAIAAQSVVFDQSWSPAPRTRPSFLSSTTGRWPFPALDTATFGEVLGLAGFSTAGVVANVHLTPAHGFADGFGWWQYENAAVADEQVDRGLAWLRAHQDEDSFLFLHLMDPHVFYQAPPPYTDRFTAGLEPGLLRDRYNRWLVLRWDQRGQLTAQNKQFMVGRYDGEIAYTDQAVARLAAALDALPGRTLLVIHTDHGEEFFEHGSYEHNHTLYNELVHSVFLVRPPGGWGGGPHRVSQPVSLVDLAPTLYDGVGLPKASWPTVDGLSLAPLLDAARAEEAPALLETLADRPLPLGHLMYDTERWGVVWKGWKYILQTTSGEEELYNLVEDPTEQVNRVLQRREQLAPMREALARATGWPVGTGWRVEIRNIDEPFALIFEEPVREAGVFDPEAGRERRANLPWGEHVLHRPEEVATVTVSEDGRSVTIQPGEYPTGTIYVLGPNSESRARIVLSRSERPVTFGLQGLAGGVVRFKPGPVIVPKDSEAARLLGKQGSDDEAAIEALKELGYLE